MLWYLIPLTIIIASLGVLIWLIIRKAPQLMALNVDSIAEVKEGRVKNRIILQRLLRRLREARAVSIRLAKPAGAVAQQLVKKMQQKIVELERMSAEQAAPFKKIDLRQEITETLGEATKFLEQNQPVDAEMAYIHVIELDGKNIDAYEGLVAVYIASRDYKKARETARFALKLLTKSSGEPNAKDNRHRLASCYAELAEIYQLEHKNSYALANIKKAVELEPNNPRFLDFLLKISILLKDKTSAQNAFAMLKEADPENKKLPELQDEIKELIGEQPHPESVKAG